MLVAACRARGRLVCRGRHAAGSPRRSPGSPQALGARFRYGRERRPHLVVEGGRARGVVTGARRAHRSRRGRVQRRRVGARRGCSDAGARPPRRRRRGRARSRPSPGRGARERRRSACSSQRVLRRRLRWRVRRDLPARPAARASRRSMCAPSDRDDDDAARRGRAAVLSRQCAPRRAPSLDAEEIARCETAAIETSAGLRADAATGREPRGRRRRISRCAFPATGGALYGRATHGWRASFQRAGGAVPAAGALSGGGERASGAGGADGGAVGAPGGAGGLIGGLGSIAPVAPRGLWLVVC